MSIDEVSKTLGKLEQGMTDQTKLVSKLFDMAKESADERRKSNASFDRHVAEEKAHWNRVGVLENEVNDFKPMIGFVEACAKREAAKAEMWRKLRDSVVKWGVLGLLTFAAGWILTHAAADLANLKGQ